ncbi:MAG: hypothetical protein ACJ762_19360 [Solirubrobacteraceae bacterium]
MIRDPDPRVAALAKAQNGVLTHRQLAELGLDVDDALAAGRLRPVLPGVYAVGARILSPEGRSTAAVLATLTGLADAPMPAEIRAALDRGRSKRPMRSL